MFPLHLLTDRIHTFLDFTARGGFLDPQDDKADRFSETLPIDKLRADIESIGMRLVDMRQTPRKGRGKARGTRKLAKIRSILWHQTASLVDLRHALGIPAHALILEDCVVLLHPIAAYLYHSGAGNATTIGVEIRARACGILGDLRTLWRSRKEISKGVEARDLVHEATDKQLLAGVFLGTYYVEEMRRRDEDIEESTFHRLTSGSRVSDPGSRIALGVALKLAVMFDLLFAETVLGDGKPCPTAWGGAPRVPYNWRVRGY